MRLAASHEVVGRIRGQAPVPVAPVPVAPVPVDPVDQLHDQVAHYIAKGFAPEAATQLAARQSIPTRFA